MSPSAFNSHHSTSLTETVPDIRSHNGLQATLVPEQGTPSSFYPEDDEEDEEEDDDMDMDITASNVPIETRKVRKQRRNSAMEDTNFLRKRTASLLELAFSDTPPAALSSRGMKIERKTFHFLFDAWAFSREADAPDQALNLLECMEHMGHGNPMMQPDVRSYTKVINAISRSGRPSAGQDAEQILVKMDHLSRMGDYAVKPNSYTYTALMEAHVYSGQPGSEFRVAELLDAMISEYLLGDGQLRPTARAFNAAINAFGKAGDAANAQDVFDRMEQLFLSGESDVKPKTFNFNALISAWANSNEMESAQRAGAVLERMEYLFQSGDPDIKPTTVSYNAVIDAFAKSGEEDAPKKAEDILYHMASLYESGENVAARPNTRSFNTVINAWAKSGQVGAADVAEELLDVMTRMSQDGNKNVQPDVHSFCTVINAWARSQKSGKAERSYNLYRQMSKLFEQGNKRARPNVVAVNAVMNACAYTVGDVIEQNRAVEIAHKLLKELESSEYGTPDQVTYGTFLKVCANQMPDSNTRQQIVQVLFKKCARDGQVGNLVLQQMKVTVSEDMFFEIVGIPAYDLMEMEDLPRSWWCNVVEGKWRRKRTLN